jgi:hypothetical protein
MIRSTPTGPTSAEFPYLRYETVRRQEKCSYTPDQ